MNTASTWNILTEHLQCNITSSNLLLQTNEPLLTHHATHLCSDSVEVLLLDGQHVIDEEDCCLVQLSVGVLLTTFPFDEAFPISNVDVTTSHEVGAEQPVEPPDEKLVINTEGV